MSRLIYMPVNILMSTALLCRPRFDTMEVITPGRRGFQMRLIDLCLNSFKMNEKLKLCV
jgi:hypothetical protein